MSRRRHFRFHRTRLAAVTAAAAAYGWTTHPGWTVLALCAAAGLAVLVWAWRRRPDDRDGWIYHLPGWDRSLVYVGQTRWPERRMAQHQGHGRAPSWFAEYVDWSRVTWYGPLRVSDRQLDQIEADHIHTFKPWANRVRCEELRRPRALRHHTARSAA